MAFENESKTESLTIFDFSKNLGSQGPALKILIADDDPPSRTLLSTSLKQWGYEVIEAADGEEAWSILQKPNPPRLMILDWIMPKLDGINLCTKIRKELYDSASFYIILLSQVSGNSNIRLAIDGGANEFMSKPFDYQELRSRVLAAARLIAFANGLAEENKRVKKVLPAVQELSVLIFALSRQMDALLKSGADAAQIDELNKIIKKAEALIKEANI